MLRPSHARPPRHALDADDVEVQLVRRSWKLSLCHACPRTALGLAQLRLALMCGPGPGAPVGVQKYGYFCTPYLCTDGRSHPYSRARRSRGGRLEAGQVRRISRQMLRVASSKRQAGPRPATSLAEATCEAPGKLLAGAACEETSRATTLGVESSDTIDNVKDQDWKSTCLVACGSSRRSTTHESTWDQMMKTPGKTLAGDDSKAPGKPCRGRSLGRGQARARQGFATSPPLQCDDQCAN